MADELSGNLTESTGNPGGGVADQPGPIDPEAMTGAEAEKQQEPTAAPPWTHMLDDCKARVLSPRGEPGDRLHIEVLVPEGEPAPGVEKRIIEQSLWDERAVPFTVDQAEAETAEEIPAQPEVLPGDQAPSSGAGSEPAEASEPTLTELASLVGVELEELADESFIVRGKDLPKGGLFVEPDKIRALLEGIRDGNWRDV